MTIIIYVRFASAKLLVSNVWLQLAQKVESLKRNGSISDMVTFSHFYTTMNSVWASQMLMVTASLIHARVRKMDQRLILLVVMSIVELRVPQSCVTMVLLKLRCLVFRHFAERTSGLVLFLKICIAYRPSILQVEFFSRTQDT